VRHVLAALLLLAGLSVAAQARVVELRITADQPAFSGQAFGAAGPYRHLTGVARGEVDPADPQNALIQDLWLAPRNARGRVEYQADIDLLLPSHGSRVLLLEVPNRGNKLDTGFFELSLPPGAAVRNALRDPGDALLLREGFTLAWFGWEADLMPGEGRLRLAPVVARQPDGRPITGVVRMEISTDAPAPDLPLGARADTVPPTAYPAARVENTTPDADGFLPSLTARAHQQDPRVPIAAADWHFGACDGGADPTRLCLRGGFQPGRLYELIYRALDPLVLGLGFAAARDIGDFLRRARADESGHPNPAWQANQLAIIEGSSQSGRFIRSFLQLGFNQAEAGAPGEGHRVFDAAFAHIAAGLLPLNLRFGQPHRNGGDQSDHDYPGYAFPFSYARQSDPLTGTSAGLLDRCRASDTCPKIFHVATSLEFWELRQSLGLTDPLGRSDQPDAPDVRTYVMAGTQHIPAAPGAPPGHCQQAPNPNPQTYTMRALLLDLVAWVRDGVAPPASVAPRLADGTLVAGDEVRFPALPARPALPPILPTPTPLHVLAYGPRYDPGTLSGIIDLAPPRALPGDYGVRVPQVDADGNDLAGIRSVFLQVPIGTYTGWNLNRAGWFEDGLCHLHGSFLPFAATRAERLQNGDPRRSIEERYPDKAAYVDAIRHAAASLNAQRFLLPEDMQALIEQAEHDGIRTKP
jgi:hypothetical protein